MNKENRHNFFFFWGFSKRSTGKMLSESCKRSFIEIAQFESSKKKKRGKYWLQEERKNKKEGILRYLMINEFKNQCSESENKLIRNFITN